MRKEASAKGMIFWAFVSLSDLADALDVKSRDEDGSCALSELPERSYYRALNFPSRPWEEGPNTLFPSALINESSDLKTGDERKRGKAESIQDPLSGLKEDKGGTTKPQFRSLMGRSTTNPPSLTSPLGYSLKLPSTFLKNAFYQTTPPTSCDSEESENYCVDWDESGLDGPDSKSCKEVSNEVKVEVAQVDNEQSVEDESISTCSSSLDDCNSEDCKDEEVSCSDKEESSLNSVYLFFTLKEEANLMVLSSNDDEILKLEPESMFQALPKVKENVLEEADEEVVQVSENRAGPAAASSFEESENKATADATEEDKKDSNSVAKYKLEISEVSPAKSEQEQLAPPKPIQELNQESQSVKIVYAPFVPVVPVMSNDSISNPPLEPIDPIRCESPIEEEVRQLDVVTESSAVIVLSSPEKPNDGRTSDKIVTEESIDLKEAMQEASKESTSDTPSLNDVGVVESKTPILTTPSISESSVPVILIPTEPNAPKSKPIQKKRIVKKTTNQSDERVEVKDPLSDIFDRPIRLRVMGKSQPFLFPQRTNSNAGSNSSDTVGVGKGKRQRTLPDINTVEKELFKTSSDTFNNNNTNNQSIDNTTSNSAEPSAEREIEAMSALSIGLFTALFILLIIGMGVLGINMRKTYRANTAFPPPANWVDTRLEQTTLEPVPSFT